MARKLDPKAPKPRAATYKIQYWSAIKVGFGMTKGKPGDFIVFYDKHGNRLKSFRYDQKRKGIITAYGHKEEEHTVRPFSTPADLNNIAELGLDVSAVKEAK